MRSPQANPLLVTPVFILIGILEALAIGGGNKLVSHVLGTHSLGAAWIALVVGVHFLALARFVKVPIFYPIGASMSVVALCNGTGYFLGWSAHTLLIGTALPSAVVLFSASWYGIVTSTPKRFHPLD